MAPWQLLRIVVGFFLFLMGGLTALLVFESIELKRQIEQLRMCQQEYKNYIQKLYQENVAYKKEEPLFNDFLMLNRASDYLKAGALEFAKEQDMERAIEEIYTSPELLASVYPNPVISVNKKPHKKVFLPLKLGVRSFKTKDFAGQWPLHNSQFWLSSKFGPRKKHDGTLGFHYGVDMAALKGTPVYAIAEGIVNEATYSDWGYGNSIVIVHTKKYTTRYAHLDQLCVKKGQRVMKGTLIGRVGATGSVRGKNASHLHFEVQVFGKRINPLYILS